MVFKRNSNHRQSNIEIVDYVYKFYLEIIFNLKSLKYIRKYNVKMNFKFTIIMHIKLIFLFNHRLKN
jgi:hypothetical protein